MTTTLVLTVNEDGLRLPRQLFPQLGEVEIVGRDDYILIKPRAGTAAQSDIRTRAIAALREAGLAVALNWPKPPVISPEERAALARRVGIGRPLSETIIEDRADRV